MTYLKIPTALFSCFLLFLSSSAVFGQQPKFHISRFSEAALSAENAARADSDDALVSDITDTGSDSYLEAVSKSDNRSTSFSPTPSDLLIQQAENKFLQGKHAYDIKDANRARTEFDHAIELMLQASEGPSDRQLFENKLEQMVDSIHRLDLAGLGAAAPAEEPQFEKAPLESILQLTFPVDPKLKTKVRVELGATASQLPLVMNDAVLGYIHYFSGRGHNTIVSGLERAGRYRAMIERVLAEEGVPPELIHLAQAESGFLPRAVSNKAATGMWQFVKFRGQQYGLNQTGYTDERLDPEKATRAAARHLHDLYNDFGNWYLAIAAYNCGPGNIQKAIERTGYADFWELRARHAIPTETTNYVPIILAMTIMTKNAAEYGLEGVVPQPALEYDTVEIDSPTHLALVGDLADTPVSQLVQLNPALLKNVAPSGYSLRIPKGSGSALAAALNTIPATQRASYRMHRVETGDTLATIARRYGSSASRIASANQLSSDFPVAGERLLIPASFQDGPSAKRRAPVRTASRRAPLRRRSSALLASAHRHKG